MNDVIDPRDLYATLDLYLYSLFNRSLIRRSEIIPTKCMRPLMPLPVIDRSLLRSGYDCSILQYRAVCLSARLAQSERVHQTGSRSI